MRRPCVEEIDLPRRDVHAGQVRRRGLPKDVVCEAVETAMSRAFCAMLAPLMAVASGRDGGRRLLGGVSWRRLAGGSGAWAVAARADLAVKLARVRQMVRQVAAAPEAQPHRLWASACGTADGCGSTSGADSSADDWEVTRYHEGMVRYYRGRILDTLALLPGQQPERLHDMDLRL
jgi:hypothetical protein